MGDQLYVYDGLTLNGLYEAYMYKNPRYYLLGIVSDFDPLARLTWTPVVPDGHGQPVYPSAAAALTQASEEYCPNSNYAALAVVCVSGASCYYSGDRRYITPVASVIRAAVTGKVGKPSDRVPGLSTLRDAVERLIADDPEFHEMTAKLKPTRPAPLDGAVALEVPVS